MLRLFAFDKKLTRILIKFLCVIINWLWWSLEFTKSLRLLDFVIMVSTFSKKIYSSFLFDCVFYVRPSDFWSQFNVRHVTGALIMKQCRPLLPASYEVILHPLSIWLQQQCYPLWGFEPRAFGSWVVCFNRSTRELVLYLHQGLTLPNFILVIEASILDNKLKFIRSIKQRNTRK